MHPPVLSRARIVGPRLELAGQTSADAAELFPLVHGRAPILDKLAWNGPAELAELEALFANWRPGGGAHGWDYFFVLRLVHEGRRACGHCGIRFSGWQRGSGLPRIGDIGYWMGEADWGRGLMTEAVQLLVWLAFERLAADGVCGRTIEANGASQRVLEKAGLTRDRAYVPPAESAHGEHVCERRYVLERAAFVPGSLDALVVEAELAFEA